MNTAPNRADEPYRGILIPTDFSENAENAAFLAGSIARSHGVRLIFLHVIEDHADRGVPLRHHDDVDQRLTTLRSDERFAGVKTSHVIATGDGWDTISRMASEQQVDMIVMGARGQTVLPRLRLGSTADRVLRSADVPVLCVHPDDRTNVEHFDTIVVATDCAEPSAIVVAEAARFARQRKQASRIVLVHAYHVPMEYTMGFAAVLLTEDFAEIESEVVDQLNRVAEPLRGDGFEVDIVAREGYPVTVIEDVTRDVVARMLVVGTHGRKGLHRVLLGSIAERMVHHAACPVYVVPTAGHAPATDDAGTAQGDHQQPAGISRDAESTRRS